MTLNEGLPYEIKILSGFIKVGWELVKANLNAAIFIPETVVPRVWQAQKHLDRHNAVEILMTDWMKKMDNSKAYYDTFKEMLKMLRSAKNKGCIIIPKAISELRWVNLEGNAEELLGRKLLFFEGKNEDGIKVKGNSRFHGEVLVTLRENYKGEQFISGKIVINSLPEKAKNFLEKTDKAFKAAIDSLPHNEVKEVHDIVGNF